MPQTFDVTPFKDADRTDILDLWARALPLDAVSADVFESRVLLDENFDPQTFLVARNSDNIVGFVIGTFANRMPLGDADPKGTRSWITLLAVDPGENIATLGTTLIKNLEDRFRSLGKKEIWVSTYPPGYFTPGIDQNNYRPLLETFLANGYIKHKEALSMDSPIVLFQLPASVLDAERKLAIDGISIRSYRRSDLLPFLGFLERTMPSDWVRVERRNLRKMSEGTFHPEQITVVVRGDEIIGYCQFEGSHFGPFGVADAYQGKGIGTVLLARTIDRMKQHGYHDAWVMWTDDVAAKVYSKFGFRESRRFAILHKEL